MNDRLVGSLTGGCHPESNWRCIVPARYLHARQVASSARTQIYAQPWSDVCRRSDALTRLGVRAGDRMALLRAVTVRSKSTEPRR